MNNNEDIDYDFAEQFQIAITKAIASSCNFMHNDGTKPDRQSVDLSISTSYLDKDLKYFVDSHIDLQLKTAINPTIINNIIKYPLKVKNYNELIGKRRNPKYLFVMIIPDNKKMWIHKFNNGIFLPCKYYWVNLEKYPPSNNKTSVTVDIPMHQELTCESLMKMLEYAIEGKIL